MKFGKVLSNQSHYTDLHHMRLVPCCYVTFVANANWIWCIQILREKWELLLSESHCARLQFLDFSAGCSQRKHEIFFMLSNNTRKITLLQLKTGLRLQHCWVWAGKRTASDFHEGVLVAALCFLHGRMWVQQITCMWLSLFNVGFLMFHSCMICSVGFWVRWGRGRIP